MPIVKGGPLQSLGFLPIQKVLIDLARYSRTSKIPEWAYALRQENETDEELISRVIVEAAEMALTTHKKISEELKHAQHPGLF